MIAVELLLDISWFAIFARLGRTIQAKMHEKPRDPNLLVLEKAELPKASEGKRRLFSFLARFLKRPVSPAPPMPELYSEKDEDQAKKRKADPSISQNTPLLQEKEPEPLFQPPSEDDILELAKERSLNENGSEEKKRDEERKADTPKETEETLAASESKKEEDKTEDNKGPQEESKQEEKKQSLFSLPHLFTRKEKQEKAEPKKVDPESTPKRSREPFPLPPLELLTPPSPLQNSDKENWQEKAHVLMQALSEFAIDGELVAVTPGPVVTLFEVRPASGVRVNKFLGISDDMARVLKAPSVRIISPVPGKDTVGVEIPNHKREFVNFRELVATQEFKTAQSPLTMVLGKDTAGKPVFADLAKMPHMLIAGATGTGKSVCLNSILASFLYRTQPSELKLLLIDPKRVEMSVYADEPHLIHPVVNEPANAKNALEWATEEMDKRFKSMAALGVRNISGFNKRLASFGEHRPDEFADFEPLPYIAIVIDELADLMMMADRKDVENSIVRLAQLARACGIHMILATQRPSVNVVTGIIKANFPCRISFQVASSADSRTILDTVGAEKLLGRGDMLYRPGDTTLHRLHGAFLSDEEVTSIVGHWKAQTQPSYKVDFTKWISGDDGSSSHGSDFDEDDLFNDVLDFVTGEGTASISKIQRRFKIGFNRAARLVEALEAQGIVDPADGSKPRKVRR